MSDQVTATLLGVAKANPVADRLRPFVCETDEDELTEVAMFGGIGFLVRGNLAFAASTGGLLIRVGDQRDALLVHPEAQRCIMGKREMKKWLEVNADQIDDATLTEWLDRGLNFARTLPPKS